MRKISVFIMLGLLAIIAIHCVDNIISQPTNKLIAERDPLYRDLKNLEYRVRELGFMQSGIVTGTIGVYDTVYLELSYRNDQYAVLITARDIWTLTAVTEVRSNMFVVYRGDTDKPYSWLTIGQ